MGRAPISEDFLGNLMPIVGWVAGAALLFGYHEKVLHCHPVDAVVLLVVYRLEHLCVLCHGALFPHFLCYPLGQLDKYKSCRGFVGLREGGFVA